MLFSVNMKEKNRKQISMPYKLLERSVKSASFAKLKGTLFKKFKEMLFKPGPNLEMMQSSPISLRCCLKLCFRNIESYFFFNLHMVF